MFNYLSYYEPIWYVLRTYIGILTNKLIMDIAIAFKIANIMIIIL